MYLITLFPARLTPQAAGAMFLLALLTVLLGAIPAEAALRWVPADDPTSALAVGTENGRPLYMCRGAYRHYDGSLEVGVGKMWPGMDRCRVPFDGRELLVDRWEKLVGNEGDFKLVASKDGGLPPGTIQASHSGDGKPWWGCVAFAHDGAHPGYIADGDCQFGFGGEADSSRSYLAVVTTDPSVPHLATGRAEHLGGSPGPWVEVILGAIVVGACATTGTCVIPF